MSLLRFIAILCITFASSAFADTTVVTSTPFDSLPPLHPSDSGLYTDTAIVVPDSISKRILSITPFGIERTKTETILRIAHLRVGMVLDSLKEADVVTKLKRSGLFEVVRVVKIQRFNGVNLYLHLSETPRIALSQIGGGYFSLLYNRPYDGIFKHWLTLHAAFLIDNPFGTGSSFEIDGCVGKTHYLDAIWTRPFRGTPWSISSGGTIGRFASQTLPWSSLMYSEVFQVNRKLGDYSKVFLGERISHYDRTFMKDYAYTGYFLDSSSSSDILGKRVSIDTIVNRLGWNPLSHSDSVAMVYDTTWTITPNDSARYFWYGIPYKVKERKRPYNEGLISLGFSTDHRNAKFNPNGGWFFATKLSTNAAYPYQNDRRYLQWDNDFRAFTRGIRPSHALAFRIRPINRILGKGSYWDGIYMGEMSLRGYALNAFGGEAYNNRLQLSAEYRFPLFDMPSMPLKFLSWYSKSMTDFHYRIDGGFFVDAGHLWKSTLSPLYSKDKPQTGFSAGAGIRIMAPGLRKSGCIDAAWQAGPYLNEYKLNKDGTTKKDANGHPIEKSSWEKILPDDIRLYIDLPF